MNNIDIANGIVFQKIKVRKGNLEDELVCQQKIYLLQVLGTDLGYPYAWSVEGPYSSVLMDYIYNNLDILICIDFNKYSLSKTAEKNITIVNSLIRWKKDDLNEADWFELLSSLLYIAKNKESWRFGNNELSWFTTLTKNKPRYTMKQCEYAKSILDKAGFSTYF